MINLKRGLIWYVLTIGLVSILYALDVDRFLTGTIYQILLLGFAIAPFFKDRQNKGALGLVKIQWWVGVLAYLIAAAASFIYNWLMVGELTLPKLDVRLLYIIALAPVGEELFFRGYLQPVIEVKTRKWVGLLITTLLFTAAHLPKTLILQEGIPLSLITIFIFGAVLGIIRGKTSSVYNSILFHGGWNLVSLFFGGIPQG